MPYFITSFQKPLHHKAGDYNRDIKRVSPLFPNRYYAEKYLYGLMSKNRHSGMFLRIDWNIRHNPVVYADLDEMGGLVRFRSRDGYHWTSAITLQEFRQRLIRMSKYA